MTVWARRPLRGPHRPLRQQEDWQTMDSSFEFNYKINGRKVSQDEWMRHLADEARSAPAEELSVRRR